MPQADDGRSGDKPRSASLPGWRDTVIGALNGVLGDYLSARRNDLAIEMALYHRNRPLPLEVTSIRDAHPDPTSKICVLVHGVCCTEGSWSFPDDEGTSYGSLLREQLGYTPFYVRYNTGLRVATNGLLLAKLLDRLLAVYPVEGAEIVLIGHSMGGLVLRSACMYGDRLGHRWVEGVRHAVHLASPHLGSPLERLGRATAAVLHDVPDPVARAVGDLIDLRSSGIKDLRQPALVDEDWEGLGPDAGRRVDIRQHVAAGTLTRNEHHLIAQLFGDGLVPVPSATGVGEVPTESLRVFPGLGHMSLARHAEVYEQIKAWIA